MAGTPKLEIHSNLVGGRPARRTVQHREHVSVAADGQQGVNEVVRNTMKKKEKVERKTGKKKKEKWESVFSLIYGTLLLIIVY